RRLGRGRSIAATSSSGEYVGEIAPSPPCAATNSRVRAAVRLNTATGTSWWTRLRARFWPITAIPTTPKRLAAVIGTVPSPWNAAGARAASHRRPAPCNPGARGTFHPRFHAAEGSVNDGLRHPGRNGRPAALRPRPVDGAGAAQPHLDAVLPARRRRRLGVHHRAPAPAPPLTRPPRLRRAPGPGDTSGRSRPPRSRR